MVAWENYSLTTELNKKAQPVQVATLMTVIGEDAREVCSTFTDWAEEGDNQKIAPVLKKEGEYCKPCKNIPFERYHFNRRVQDPGRDLRSVSYSTAKASNFEAINSEEILRDHLLFGIRDNKVRERLLRETSLTFAKTDEISRASETMTPQMKLVENQMDPSSLVNAVTDQENQNNCRRCKPKEKDGKNTDKSEECWSCGTVHNSSKKEL